MSTSRLADQRIRASSSQVVGLDVRGPVSRALARAGVEVPPARLADETGEAAAGGTEPTASAPARTASRPKTPAARRVVKPFADAPWPTRAPKADPKAVLSGLTADERRVHRILLDTLAMQNDQGYGQGMVGLSYTEKQKLAVLNLAFIDDRLAAGASDHGQIPHTPLIAGLLALSVAAAAAFVAGWAVVAIALVTVAVALLLIDGLMAQRTDRLSTPQRRIYEALRELALLADPNDVTSDALAQADAVIDRLAADDRTPRLSLDVATPAPTASASRTRARS